MNNKILGLDIGVASVGVGIIDKNTGEIIHSSSRIFPAANADNNKTRRENRQSRRLNRRKKLRLRDVEQLFIDYHLLDNIQSINLNLNPYELRVKGLESPLTNEELFAALKNIVKHRGISYLDDAEDDTSSGSDYKKAVENNIELLKVYTPGQIQLQRFNQYGQLRSNFTVEENGEIQRLINVFSTSSYRQEAELILQRQQSFNDKITDEFIASYLSILTRKREYYIGPGNEKSRTDYGVYRTNGKTLENLFEILIGKCSYYPKEYRASKASYTAQEFNLLNDLNNLSLPTGTGKLTTEHKRQIVDFVKQQTKLGPAQLFKYIAKLVGCKVDEISGYRLDTKSKALIHTMDVYRKMMITLPELQVLTILELNDMAHILTLNTETPALKLALGSQLGAKLSNDIIDRIILFRKQNATLFSQGWHNLSNKIMLEIIPELYATSDEQMTIFSKNKYANLKQQGQKQSTKTKYISEFEITDEIYNPVVAKAIRQTIKIINLAIKKYGQFDEIVIEMARDKNEKEMKDKIMKAQANNKEEKDKALQKAAALLGSQQQLNINLSKQKGLLNKIRLWYQQQEKCLYTGKTIAISDLITYPNTYEVDHIIPLSLSFDDSFNNKVLVCSEANQEKGQRTPYQYLISGGQQSYTNFKKLVLSLKGKGLTNKKVEYLLLEQDVTKEEVRRKFIERNIVDTRYASRVVLNTLQAHFKDTKISVIRGAYTSQLRCAWRIDKTRETYHHHAIDALIIAGATQTKLWKKQNHFKYDTKAHHYINTHTGEILDTKAYKNLAFKPPYHQFLDTLKDDKMNERILFSYQVDSKINRQITDATIYSTRQVQLNQDKEETWYVIDSIKDIYSQKGYEDFVKKYTKDKTQFLMYHHDPKTFAIIEKILQIYPNNKLNDKGKEIKCNPFEEYRNEHGMIKKYSKKDNGPTIKKLKYYSNKLGNHVDITKPESLNKTVLQSLNPWRTDIYYNDKNGKYEILGLKYADLKFEKGTGKYHITLEHYNELKKAQKISEEAKFKFTLYKHDLLLIKDSMNNDSVIVRVLSKNSHNHLQIKPYDKPEYEAHAQILPIFNKAKNSGQYVLNISKEHLSLYKVKTDVLGHKYYIKQEGEVPELNF